MRIDPSPSDPSYLRVAENYYPDWHATIDGQPATVMRGQYTLMSVELPAGAQEVTLEFRSRRHSQGKVVTMISLVLVATVIGVPIWQRRRGNG